MNRDNGYLIALEKRVTWLQWCRDESARSAWQTVGDVAGQDYAKVLPTYERTLERGDTFYMNKKFCSLVEHARLTIPDDITFEETWMQAKSGWMWIDQPFEVPSLVTSQNLDIETQEIDGIKLKVAAIGWFSVPAGTVAGSREASGQRVAGAGATMFLLFQDFNLYKKDFGGKEAGFGCWSYFMLQNGDRLIDRIKIFEKVAAASGGAYANDRSSNMMHEIRWTYAALHLMNQRLATTVQSPLNRAMRRQGSPLIARYPPFVKVVTLRRLEEEREKAERDGENPVEWNWQWEVRGHWREQYYPSTKEYKTIFIEAYIKGPNDKPLKPPGHKIFIAKR
jgi:hypothetical protein